MEPDVETVVAGMISDQDSARKLAVYHLQSLLADPSFADAFIQGNGLPVLRRVVMQENGNTLAYALGSLTRLLEVELGWETVGTDIIGRAVEIVVTRPVINILRNALYLLVLVVSRPFKLERLQRPTTPSSTKSFGFKALKPMLQTHDAFLDCLVDRLSSADHALCANALHLMNALMRDSIVNGGEDEWPRFITRLQELGVISGVEALMRGDAVADLVGPILEFQNLTKILLRRWRAVRVDVEKPEHRRALRQLDVSSFPPDYRGSGSAKSAKGENEVDKHAPDMWRRLGFETESPAWEFEETGFLGMMDLAEFVRKNADMFQKELLEQSVMPVEKRCPIARASLSVTMMLYDHFEIDSGADDEGFAHMSVTTGRSDSRLDSDRVIQPLLLRWEDVHAASLNVFLRLWKAAGAKGDEFHKIEDLVRLVIGRVVGEADRRASTERVQHELGSVTLPVVRQWQLEDLEEVYDQVWGPHLRQVREQTRMEALNFMREQRIRCLLKGSWFPYVADSAASIDLATTPAAPQQAKISSWRFVRLSQNRRYLHYADHVKKQNRVLPVSELPNKVNLDAVSSVVSNVTTSPGPLVLDDEADAAVPAGSNGKSPPPPPGTAPTQQQHKTTTTITRLTIHGSSSATLAQPQPVQSSASTEQQPDPALLELHTLSPALASEWLDGLLMLLDQQPITADTNKLLRVVETWGERIRMLNLQWEDVDWERIDSGEEVMVPPREGTEGPFWYNMGDE